MVYLYLRTLNDQYIHTYLQHIIHYYIDIFLLHNHGMILHCNLYDTFHLGISFVLQHIHNQSLFHMLPKLKRILHFRIYIDPFYMEELLGIVLLQLLQDHHSILHHLKNQFFYLLVLVLLLPLK